ncbi:MAG: hypothetical protein HUJ31_12495 [Pseudomonadales bacterium]|nr:hypothetical protein [Pseudomonadales bacterium]
MRESRRAVRKKRSGFGVSPVLVCVVILGLLATPVFFLVGYVFNRLHMAIWQFRLSRRPYDFWLTSEESMEYLKKTNRFNQVRRLLANAAGDPKSAVYKEYQTEHHALARDLERLQGLPMKRWQQYRVVVARANTFLFCLLTWCAVVVYFHWPVNEATIATIIDEYSRLAFYLPALFSAGDGPQPLGSDLLWAISNAALWPVLLYIPFQQVGALLAHLYSRRPDEVNFGSVSASLNSGQVKAVFVATAPPKVDPIIEILDAPDSPEPGKQPAGVQ